MSFKRKVGRRGKDLAIRIPAEIVRALQLKPGDEVDVSATPDGQIEISRKELPGL